MEIKLWITPSAPLCFLFMFATVFSWARPRRAED